MFVNNLQKFGFPLSPCLVGIKTSIHKFPVLIVDIVTKFGTIENFKVSVHYWSSLYRERNTEKQKTHCNRSETPPNITKTQVIHTREHASRFYYFFPHFELFFYDHYIPIQTLILTLLRNVTLTVPKGAWATCEVIGPDQSGVKFFLKVMPLLHKNPAYTDRSFLTSCWLLVEEPALPVWQLSWTGDLLCW